MARLKPSTADNAPVPFIDFKAQQARIGPAIERAMARVVEHGQFILGPEVAQLEKALADFCGANHCVTCANGTDALTLVLMAQGIGPGDAVLVPSFTFVATAETVAQLGATPIFVDISPSTFNLEAMSLERAVSAAKQGGLAPRMVIAVDLYGHPAEYDAIAPVARSYGLVIVADAAQSFGAEQRGRKVGTLADYTTTSFFPSKPLGCYGDGGAIFTNDVTQAALLRSLRGHGQGSHKYDNVRVGVNSRLDTLQAAILLEKLKVFPEEIAARSEVARRYGQDLGRIVRVPCLADGALSAWAQYTVLLPNYVDREAVQKACARAKVPTAVYYPRPLHQQGCYQSYPRDPAGLPVTEQMAGRVLSLPMHAYLDAATQELVVEALSGAVAPRG